MVKSKLFCFGISLFIVIFVCVPVTLTTQEIKDLPAGLNTDSISTSTLNNAFSKLHSFSEHIYNSKKIKIIDSENWEEITQTDLNIDPAWGTLTWGTGSWGRGYFTQKVDIYVYNSKNHKYSDWYSSDSSDNWSSHPLIRDTGRRISAYIHKYRSGDPNSTYNTRIVKGLRYLLGQQRDTDKTDDGAYIYWRKRPNKNIACKNDIPGPNWAQVYPTAMALRGLSEGYLFLEEENHPNTSLRNDISTAIRKAADWMKAQPEKWKNSTGCINYRALCLEGIISAYRVTNDNNDLDDAVDIFEIYINPWQNDDGAWFLLSDCNEALAYHDTKPCYMGIILRSMVNLYEIIPANYGNKNLSISSRKNLRNRIIKTINHFLIGGLAYPNDPEKPRLQSNGKIAQYIEYYNCKGKSILFGHFIMEALCDLIRGNLFNTFSQADKQRITGFLNAIIRPIVNFSEIKNTSDTNMRSIGLYLNTPTNTQPPGNGPQKPHTPYPADGATGILPDVIVTWGACSGSESPYYNVYFGTLSDNPYFQGNLVQLHPEFTDPQYPGLSRSFIPGKKLYSGGNKKLKPSTWYYWKIESLGPGGTTEGDIWKFKTIAAPQKPHTPYPADGATGVPTDVIITWGACARSESPYYNVYFGTLSNNPYFQGNLVQLHPEFTDPQYPGLSRSFIPGKKLYSGGNKKLRPSTWYYWKIESLGPGGITSGIIWKFETGAN